MSVLNTCLECRENFGHKTWCSSVPVSKPPQDLVTAPPHYTRFKIQPIEFILANGLSFLQASVLKYLCRYPYKNGMEDLLKCRNMLDRLIEDEKAKLAPENKA